MTDTHLRILAKAARHSQRRLEEHDASEIPAAAESSARRRGLETTATRTKAQFAAAQARRRYPPKD